MSIRNIGIKIREARRGKHYTQAELAELLDCSVTTIKRWESGQTFPSYTDLFTIAEKLGVPPEDVGLIPATEEENASVDIDYLNAQEAEEILFELNDTGTGIWLDYGHFLTTKYPNKNKTRESVHFIILKEAQEDGTEGDISATDTDSSEK